MHGRLKVKSAAHLEQEKAVAKQKKLDGYRKAMALIFQLRKQNEVGSQEEADQRDFQLLKMSENVLLSNAAISSLWNIRREVILNRISNSESEDESEVLLSKEKEVTQHCLMSDPKSYGAWHHRGWAMNQLGPKADWQQEVDLTTRFLQMDERNFHCWDYRRFVLTKLPPSNGDSQTSSSAAKELQFSTDAIHINFSNYSAWHYRSKLLPLVHPNKDSLIGICEEVRRNELDLVQNAAFTDPEDSSAWFYHRWLLASGDHDDTPKIQLAKKLSSLNGGGKLVVVATSKDIKGGLSCWLNSREYFFTSASSSVADSLWLAQLDDDADEVTLVLTVDGHETERILLKLDKAYVAPELLSFRTSRNDSVTEQLLVDEMDNCRQLLELEPDSKWTMLTLALIAQSVDPLKHYEEIVDIYDNLAKVDAKRRRYYADQKSKFVTRHQLTKFFQCLDQGQAKLDLSGKSLTVVYFKQLFSLATEIDLTSNPELKSVAALLPYLTNCQKLFVDAIHSKGCDLPENFKGKILCKDGKELSEVEGKI